ncbi:MAG: hypothetical protein HC836_28665 [Richelia sp. RM2_1_2]|nr:hypothetical protein [Richelia sp. SM1_7_0]NJN08309.1 hypothetical protein [Richelia sp. RM1_1_1]NJO62063.1 hypothetical protein [Richelia sp. RM2_1_2]
MKFSPNPKFRTVAEGGRHSTPHCRQNPKSVLESFGVRESTPQTFRKI